ncbi:hypothetical protein IWT140_01739 [Secundilactobacillus pentosiphilus]|uniref:Uncharacterized protein n=1 Tax=Secundilactobacillus pentosiphilus TaxID=1714682 RepID=A0A1Z5IR85_9LACO|nr:hypothetical protein [Secundilactobacillus pentosiphilus]GAX04102.1 hypothetical protein IWT140_01739 [Secundilactobacillus pentosiphilus]
MSKKVTSMVDKHIDQGKMATVADIISELSEDYQAGNIDGIAFVYQKLNDNGDVENHSGYAYADPNGQVQLFSLIGGIQQLSADLTRDTFGDV